MDIFEKRMKMATKDNGLGDKLVDNTNLIEKKTFRNSQSIRFGTLYDWDLNPLEDLYFRFEKVKTFTGEGYEVEYYVRFEPNYNPEFIYRSNHFMNDNKERFGFYIDVLDRSKDKVEKWLIVGKDDKVAFDRYIAYKCNWCLEWINNGIYKSCICCVRTSQSKSANEPEENKLNGSTINNTLSVIIPTNENVMGINYSNRFMITDNLNYPQTYEITNMRNISPLGITTLYLKQTLFNKHTDFCGDVNNTSNVDFIFDRPILDLDEDFGTTRHMICDCIKDIHEEEQNTEEIKLKYTSTVLYVNKNTLMIESGVDQDEFASNDLCWEFVIDKDVYSVEDLENYFSISMDNDISISCINKDMVNYDLLINLKKDDDVIDCVKLEVKR